MPKLDLSRLQRDRSVQVVADLPGTAAFGEDSDLEFDGPLAVDVQAHIAGSGEIVVRGTVRGRMRRACRRCLDPVEIELDHALTLVFAEEGAEELEDAGDVRAVATTAAELDLRTSIREELILADDRFVVCRPDCRGLCPMCGTNLNEENCDCSREGIDPRWEALRTMTSE